MSQVDRHWNLCVLSIIRSRYYFYPSHLQSNIQDVMQLAQLVFIYNQLGGQLSLAGWHTQLNILCWHWYVLIEYVRILQALAWLILNSQVQWRKREFQEERLSTVVQNFQIYWCGLLIHTKKNLTTGKKAVAFYPVVGLRIHCWNDAGCPRNIDGLNPTQFNPPSLNRLKPPRKTHKSGLNWVLLTFLQDLWVVAIFFKKNLNIF